MPLIEITQEKINQIKSVLPELPYQKFDRFMQQLNLSAFEADVLVDDKELADYFEQALKQTKSKLLINWIVRDLIGYLNDKKISLKECKITPVHLAALVELIEQNVINAQAAKIVFEEIAQTGQDPQKVVDQKGLKQIGSSQELEKIIIEILHAYPTEVNRYKQGEQKLFGFFVGEAMKKTQGKGNPKIIQELLKKKLVE